METVVSCCIKSPVYHAQVKNQKLDMLFKKKLSTERAEEPMPLIWQAEMVSHVYPTVQEESEPACQRFIVKY